MDIRGGGGVTYIVTDIDIGRGYDFLEIRVDIIMYYFQNFG